MRKIILGAAMALLTATAVHAADEVRITKDMLSVTVETKDGPVEIKRNQDANATIDPAFAKTSRKCPPFCIEPMVVADGIKTVGELEVLDFLKEKKGILLDARTRDWYLRGTIPGSINIPYTEIAGRLDAFGCARTGATWDCAKARTALMFCNGPWCSQSPTAIRDMLREGFPPEKILYYRGGMQDWLLLGLTTVEGPL